MAIPTLDENLNIISQLSDEPNDVGTDALSANELKERFDKAGNLIKQFINEVFIPYLQSVAAAGDIGITEISGLTDASTVQTALEALKNQLDNTATGSIPDRSLTAVKIQAGAITANELADDSITASKIAAGSISDEKISSEKLSGTVLKAKTVGTGNIADKAITVSQLEDGAVETAKIKDLSVTAGKLAADAVQTAKIKDGNVTRAKLAADAATVSFINIQVQTSAWQADETYGDYPFRAAVALDGVTEDFAPSVTFAPEDALENIFAPVAETYDGGIYIYANESPAETVTIPAIVCIPVR